jgi:RES domain-containing protein
MVYTAGSGALAALEMLAHLDAYEVLEAFLLAEATFDASLVEELDAGALPARWRSDPPPLELQRIGDQWVRSSRSAVLRVPSAIIETEDNFLLNPEHPDFPRVTFGVPVRFTFDPRLAK